MALPSAQRGDELHVGQLGHELRRGRRVERRAPVRGPVLGRRRPARAGEPRLEGPRRRVHEPRHLGALPAPDGDWIPHGGTTSSRTGASATGTRSVPHERPRRDRKKCARALQSYVLRVRQDVRRRHSRHKPNPTPIIKVCAHALPALPPRPRERSKPPGACQRPSHGAPPPPTFSLPPFSFALSGAARLGPPNLFVLLPLCPQRVRGAVVLSVRNCSSARPRRRLDRERRASHPTEARDSSDSSSSVGGDMEANSRELHTRSPLPVVSTLGGALTSVRFGGREHPGPGFGLGSSIAARHHPQRLV